MKNYFKLILTASCLFTPAEILNASQSTEEPQLVAFNDHASGKGIQKLVFLEPPAKLVRYLGKAFFSEDLDASNRIDAVALKWKNIFLFFETGGQTGLDFTQADWCYPYDSPQGRMLNLLITVDQTINNSMSAAIRAYDKKHTLTDTTSETTEEFFPENPLADFSSSLRNDEILIFPRNPKLQKFFLNTGFRAIFFAYDRLNEINFRFSREPEGSNSWFDASLDTDLVTHEVGHHIHDRNAGFRDQPYESILHTPLMECSAELTSFLYHFSSLEKCISLVAKSKGNIGGVNEATVRFENIFAQRNGKIDDTNDYMNEDRFRYYNTDYALTEGPYVGQILDNGYIGSGQNDLYMLAFVPLRVIFDVHNFLYNKIRSKSAVYFDKIETQSQFYGDILFGITKGFTEAHMATIAEWDAPPTFSAFLQHFYRYLPIALKNTGGTSLIDSQNYEWSIEDKDIHAMLDYMKKRARASNLSAEKDGPFPGIDEKEGSVFYPHRKSEPHQTSMIQSKMISSTSSHSCSCPANSGPYREFQTTKWVQNPDQEYPTFNYGPTKGVSKVLPIHLSFSVYRSLEDAEEIERNPDSWKNYEDGKKRFWPNIFGEETYDPALNG